VKTPAADRSLAASTVPARERERRFRGLLQRLTRRSPNAGTDELCALAIRAVDFLVSTIDEEPEKYSLLAPLLMGPLDSAFMERWRSAHPDDDGRELMNSLRPRDGVEKRHLEMQEALRHPPRKLDPLAKQVAGFVAQAVRTDPDKWTVLGTDDFVQLREAYQAQWRVKHGPRFEGRILLAEVAEED
jgi:hypothetical protein